MDMQNMPSGSVYASGTQGAAVGSSRATNGSTAAPTPHTSDLSKIVVRVTGHDRRPSKTTEHGNRS